MKSWREDASQQAQDDLDLLVGEALELGEKTLLKSGELSPFFMAVGVDGKCTLGSLGDEVLASQVVKGLVRLLRKERARFRACAIITDQSLVGRDQDAIWVDLCHSEGAALSCYLPYRTVDDTPVFGDLGAQPSDNRIWSE